ncbi:MAG: hypothetical protein RLY71_2059 [Pseudomonadota bacterium]|jgi:hypothetical protein
MKMMLASVMSLLILVSGCGLFASAEARSPDPAPALVGILDGSARLMRQTSRFALTEGQPLQAGDIIETSAGAFAQIEWPDGNLLGLGENTQLMLQTRPSHVYMLRGWMKLTISENQGRTGFYQLPELDISTSAATLVVHREPPAWMIFVETGSAKLQARQSGQTDVTVAAGQYASGQAEGKLTVARRPDAQFISSLPRSFMDTLPARAARFAGQKIVVKPLGEVAYDDVAPWLHAATSLRQPLLERWRSRMRDPTFRAAVIANMLAHPEWERAVYPERFCPSGARRGPAPDSCTHREGSQP